MKKILITLAFFGAFILQVNAQDIVLRGKVLDGVTNEPIPGATVVELDENKRVIKGTITDPNGNYALVVSNLNTTVQFSFIGYKTEVFELGGRTNIDVVLQPESMGIDEVVITAQASIDDMTGISERNRASSATSIKLDDLGGQSVTSASDALQGQVAGLDIVSSGSPGASSNIVIRGLGTLGNARPLIIVDGIAQNVNISSDFDFGSADTEDIGDLVSISPQDIKSITVLKDAASAAKWGSRAADGVLEIETFRGTKGKTRFEYQYKYSLTREPPLMPMLNGDEYTILQLEQHHNRYGIFDVPDQIAFDENYDDFNNWNKNTDWMGAITRNGFKNEHNFKVSGGGDKTLYYASVNLNNDVGTTRNESLKRLTTRINLDYNVSSKLRFSVSFAYVNSAKEGNFFLWGDYNGDGRSEKMLVRQMAYIKPPNMSIWERDENNNLTGNYYAPLNAYQGSGEKYFNPVALVDLGINDMLRDQLENSMVLQYKINSWMEFRQTVSFQYAHSQTEQYMPAAALGTDWLDGSNDNSVEIDAYDVNTTTRSQLFLKPLVTSNHVLNSSVVWETRQSKGGFMQIQGRQTPSSQIFDPASNPVLGNNNANEEEVRDLGMLGSINYTYGDKYIINTTLRADASSKFGKNNRWGYFPSIALAWRFSSEPWFSAVKQVVSDGKFRVSYGQVGKQPWGAYIRHGQYSAPFPSQYSVHPIVVPTGVQLENLKWQTVEQFNYALDLTLLNGKFYMILEYYEKTTKDLLWQGSNAYRIPSTSGYNQLSAYNGGELENIGWELSGGGTILKTKDLLWRININISQNSNSYSEFPENFNNERATNVGNEQYPRQATLGSPVGSFYGFLFEGVYATDEDAVARDKDGRVKLDPSGKPIPMMYKDQYQFRGGDAKYADLNHDGVIDINDVIRLGDSNPDFYGGFGTSINYKFIRFIASFNYRIGYEIVNELAMSTQGMDGYNNQSTAVLRRWRRQGQSEEGLLPRAYLSHPANNLGSDRYVESGDYLRLNNVSLSFDIPTSIAGRIGLDDLKLGINLRKIYTLTNYTGQDVEINMSMDDPFWFGTDRGYSPTPKVFAFSISGRF